MKHTTKTSESHTKAVKSNQQKAEARRLQETMEFEGALAEEAYESKGVSTVICEDYAADDARRESEDMADRDYAQHAAADAEDQDFIEKSEGKRERKLARLRKAELKKLRQQEEVPAQDMSSREYIPVCAELHLPEYINADDDEELKVMEEIHAVDPIKAKSYKGIKRLVHEDIAYESRMKRAAKKAADSATAKIGESRKVDTANCKDPQEFFYEKLCKRNAQIIQDANTTHPNNAIPLAPVHRFSVGEHVQVTSTVQPARYRLPGGAEILRFKQYNGIVTYVNPDVEWITVDLGMYRESYNPRLVLKGWSSRLPTFMSMLSAVGRFSAFEEKTCGTSRLAEILGIPTDKLNLTNDSKDTLSLVPTDAIEVTQNHTIGKIEEPAGVKLVDVETSEDNLNEALEMQPLKMSAAKSRAVKTSTPTKEQQL